MKAITALEKEIFQIQSEQDFETIAERIFQFQLKHCQPYRDFCNYLGRTRPGGIDEIPFLPIQYFKTHEVYCGQNKPELRFLSSGTTKQKRSQHFVTNPTIYTESYLQAFTSFFGTLENKCILALLPSYLEQGDSSLVHMVKGLIEQSRYAYSGFLLHQEKEIQNRIKLAKKDQKEIILFGVSYALLDLADQNQDLSSCTIIETGGMKGKREEWSKVKLQAYLFENLHGPQIYSEYGMTELLSQGYAKKDEGFVFPKWMKCLLRETDDPLQYTTNSTGAINIIDLANLYSCSFIATDDLGKQEQGRLSLKGRMDQSDIRGCNLMVE